MKGADPTVVSSLFVIAIITCMYVSAVCGSCFVIQFIVSFLALHSSRCEEVRVGCFTLSGSRKFCQGCSNSDNVFYSSSFLITFFF